jgi:Na+/melibiose symporter-like transporter
VYYFNNYVDKAALAKFISPLTSALSGIGINFFGSDPVSAGFGLFNAGGIIFMIFGISLSKKLADKYGKRDVYKYGLLVATIFVLIFIFFKPENVILMFTSQILHGFSYGITIPFFGL